MLVFPKIVIINRYSYYKPEKWFFGQQSVAFILFGASICHRCVLRPKQTKAVCMTFVNSYKGYVAISQIKELFQIRIIFRYGSLFMGIFYLYEICQIWRCYSLCESNRCFRCQSPVRPNVATFY